jgi:hypothetical protein
VKVHGGCVPYIVSDKPGMGICPPTPVFFPEEVGTWKGWSRFLRGKSKFPLSSPTTLYVHIVVIAGSTKLLFFNHCPFACPRSVCQWLNIWGQREFVGM